MAADNKPGGRKKIEVIQDGQYVVRGGIPLVRKVQVVSEYGEPLTWKTEGRVEVPDPYSLCRCGRSRERPFCDMSHALEGFDGTESADTHSSAERQVPYEGGTGIYARQDPYLCMESGFCRTRDLGIEDLIRQSEDTKARSLAMAMIERCPSSSLVYSIEEGEPDIEPDLPAEVAVTTEITSDGPIQGPLWVTGNIPVERADGKPLETLNRVTLCRCGLSKIKPLCDGTHREMGIK